MPRKLERALSPRFCQTAPVGLHADGGGLYLQVRQRTDGGLSRSWIFRYRAGGRLRDMGLGPFPTVGLADARERARQARLQRLDGADPIEVKREAKVAAAVAAAKAMTFEQCATQYIEAHRSGWKNQKHSAQWSATLQAYVFPIIGALPVSAIDDHHVVSVLQPIWNAKPSTASRVRGRIERVLDRARALKLRTGENPARWTGHLDQLLPRGETVATVNHHAALPYKELPAFMGELRKRTGLRALALEFAILTATRSGDVLGAEWSEIDRAARVWVIPASRLKGRRGARRRDHVVPLSDRAIEVLDAVPKFGKYVFMHEDGARLGGSSMSQCLRAMGRGDVTTHGFRSCFKDWAADTTEYPNEMSELALAHTVSSKVEAAYRRGDQLVKRQRMMQDWCDFAAGTRARSS
jgi:integrase